MIGVMPGTRGTGRVIRGLALVTTLTAVAVSVPTAAPRADAVQMWNTEMLSLIRQTSALLVDGPPEVAREIAIRGTSMFDAVNAASGSPFASYAYGGGPVAGASAEAAALSAGYTALNTIFSNSIWTGTGGNANLINNTILQQISNAYNNALATLGGGASVTAGVNLGVSAASAGAAARAGDGSAAAITSGLSTYMPPGSGTTPGVYIPPGARPAMFPTWGTVTPFGITSSQNAAAQTTGTTAPGHGLPAIGSAAYADGLLKTQCLGWNTGVPLSAAAQVACANAGYTRTNDQVQAALFWNDPGGTIQPPGHWLQIATTLMQSQGLSLLQSARLTSLLGMGLNDAGIAAWNLKYINNLWRPLDAIRSCAVDTATGTVSWSGDFATCDTTWQSEIATPPHPDYIAGHPAFSGAAATILEGFFGVDSIGFCSTSDAYNNGALGAVAQITLCFDSFSAASSGELGSTLSRVYGGIHTPLAVDDAELIGNIIGQDILANFDVSPIPEPATLGLLGVVAALMAGLHGRAKGNLSGFKTKPA